MKDITLALKKLDKGYSAQPSPDCNGNPFLFRCGGRKDCSGKREPLLNKEQMLMLLKTKKPQHIM